MSWDAIVLLAANERQAESFRHDAAFYGVSNVCVLPDLAGFKIGVQMSVGFENDVNLGSGGAMLNALQSLHKSEGDAFFSRRILMVPAGGYSVRQPTAAACGKIFTPLPFGDGCSLLTHLDSG